MSTLSIIVSALTKRSIPCTKKQLSCTSSYKGVDWYNMRKEACLMHNLAQDSGEPNRMHAFPALKPIRLCFPATSHPIYYPLGKLQMSFMEISTLLIGILSRFSWPCHPIKFCALKRTTRINRAALLFDARECPQQLPILHFLMGKSHCPKCSAKR